MIYGSVCSGIEAATAAWHPLGWHAAWFSEIEPFPRKVLKYHYPDVPNLGDMTKLLTNKTFIHEPIELLVGGTPCQSFSLAGLRGGLADKRGNLALEFCRILIAKQPQWFVWENVPGALSSYSNDEESKVYTGNSGDVEPGYIGDGEYDITQTADFATILTAFRECGYSYSYRILDAQYFGVPQRRRRIFVVGYLGNDWRPPAAVLFEQNSGHRNIKKGGKTGQSIAGNINASAGRTGGAGIDPGFLTVGTLESRQNAGGFPGTDGAAVGHIIPWPADIVAPVDATFATKAGIDDQHIKNGASHFVPCFLDNSQVAATIDASVRKGHMPEKNQFPFVLTLGHTKQNGSGIAETETANTIEATNTINQAVYFENPKSFNGQSSASMNMPVTDNAPSLDKSKVPSVLYDPTQITSKQNRSNPQPGDPSHPLVNNGHAPLLIPQVRKLTPLECERLQGFPDNYTNIPGAKDSPRYKAIGNSMARHVMEWLGIRIDNVDKQMKLLNQKNKS